MTFEIRASVVHMVPSGGGILVVDAIPPDAVVASSPTAAVTGATGELWATPTAGSAPAATLIGEPGCVAGSRVADCATEAPHTACAAERAVCSGAGLMGWHTW